MKTKRKGNEKKGKKEHKFIDNKGRKLMPTPDDVVGMNKILYPALQRLANNTADEIFSTAKKVAKEFKLRDDTTIYSVLKMYVHVLVAPMSPDVRRKFLLDIVEEIGILENMKLNLKGSKMDKLKVEDIEKEILEGDKKKEEVDIAYR